VAFYVHKPLVRAAGLMILAGMLSMVNTPNKKFTVFGLWELVSLTLIALAANNWSASRDGLRVMRATLLVALFTQCTIILLENVTGVSFSMQEGVTGEGHWESARFAGTLVVPSVSATFVVIGLFFTLARLYSTEVPKQRSWLFGLLGLGLLVLLISLTRSAWIAFLLGGTGLAWYLLRYGTLKIRDVQRILVVLFIAVLCAWPALSGRLAANHSDDADARWNLVLIAMEMIKAHPILGVGLNNATTVLREYAAIAGLSSVWIFIVHNQFMLIAAETGFVGLFAFLLLFKVGFTSAYRAMQSDEVLVRDTGAAVFWCLIALAWALQLDHVSSSMTYVFVWFLIGMASGLRMLAEGTSEKAEPA
jgi:O-antigen ligase